MTGPATQTTATEQSRADQITRLPERYQPLVRRLDAVRPDMARVVCLAVERDGHHSRRSATRNDLSFLQEIVTRHERRSAAPDQRSPIKPQPYTRVHLDGDLRASFKRKGLDLIGALERHESGRYIDQVLDLVPRLLAQLAAWGYHPDDVGLSTPAPDGHQPPAHYVKATTNLISSSARLAKDLRDRERQGDAYARPLRVTRSLAQFREARGGAQRLLDGEPYHLPPPAVSPWVGDRRSWWVDLDGQDDGERFTASRGRMLRTRAEQPSILGPFASKRCALNAGRRATATAADMRVGLFAQLSDDQLTGRPP
jgi:hypothetical protein